MRLESIVVARRELPPKVIRKPFHSPVCRWQTVGTQTIVKAKLRTPISTLAVIQLNGFWASRGCSLGEYIATCGIDHAKRMLIADEDIKVIAHTLGFSSPASFGSAFRRATGSTPRAFKQRAPASEERN